MGASSLQPLVLFSRRACFSCAQLLIYNNMLPPYCAAGCRPGRYLVNTMGVPSCSPCPKGSWCPGGSAGATPSIQPCSTDGTLTTVGSGAAQQADCGESQMLVSTVVHTLAYISLCVQQAGGCARCVLLLVRCKISSTSCCCCCCFNVANVDHSTPCTTGEQPRLLLCSSNR
jgi:hypothetical protein